MMNEYYFTFRSITTAQLAAAALDRAGIPHVLLRTPKAMAGQGCGYSLRIAQMRAEQAARLLRQENITFQRIYQPGEIPVEVRL